MIQKEKRRFVKKRRKRERKGSRHKETIGTQECIRGIHVCILTTRDSSIAQQRYQASTEANETVNKRKLPIHIITLSDVTMFLGLEVLG